MTSILPKETEELKELIEKCESSANVLQWRRMLIQNVLMKIRKELNATGLVQTKMPAGPKTEAGEEKVFPRIDIDNLSAIERKIGHIDPDTDVLKIITLLKEAFDKAEQYLRLFTSEDEAIRRARRAVYNQRKEDGGRRKAEDGEKLPKQLSYEEKDSLEEITFVSQKVFAAIIEVLVREQIDFFKQKFEEELATPKRYKNPQGQQLFAQKTIKTVLNRIKQNSITSKILMQLHQEMEGLDTKAFVTRLESHIQKIIVEATENTNPYPRNETVRLREKV